MLNATDETLADGQETAIAIAIVVTNRGKMKVIISSATIARSWVSPDAQNQVT